jgi:predicted permease
MTRLRVAFRRLAGSLTGAFRTGARERDLDQELAFHLEMEIAENIRRGMSPDKARTAALLRFGGLVQVKETWRETRTFTGFENLGQDLRFGVRMLRRSPGLSMLAILCLTLGIGATTSVLSWVEGILLRPFPAVAHQERLVAIAGVVRATSERTDVSWPDFQGLARNCTQIESFIGDRITGTTLSIGNRAERAMGSIVSANYFDALGVRPVLGRGFEPGEDSGRNAHPVVVIGYRMWKERYRGDPAIIGRTQTLNGVVHTIVGVAPEGFYGTFVGYQFQFWVPASMQEVFDPRGYKLEDRGEQWVEGFARLKPGVDIRQAQSEVSAVAARLESQYPATNRGRGFRLYPLSQTPFNNAGTLFPTLRIVLVMAFCVLLIVCSNVGNLLLVRALSRRGEMALRLALGAGRGRLLKQLIAEGLILSSIATAGGFLVAYLCRNMVMLFYPARPGVTVNLPAEIDWRVLAVSAGVCMLTTLLLSLAPARLTGNLDLAHTMNSSSRGVVGGGTTWVRAILAAAQVSLGFVLLTSMGLLVRSMLQLQSVEPGFSTHDVLATGIDLISAGYDRPRARIFQDELLKRVQAIRGVKAAALSSAMPFSYRGFLSAPVAVDGYRLAPEEQPASEYNQVGPGYLATMGIPLLSGREFTLSDDESAAPVAIVNEVMARRYWGGRDPVGQRLKANTRWMRVIGVAGLSRYNTLMETPKPFFYEPLRQNPSVGVGLNIRTANGTDATARALGGVLRSLDPNVGVSEVITMREQVDRMSWPNRAALILLGIFGGVALLLAAIGLYGVMSHLVSQNTREFGLRMAVGANPSDLLRYVLSRGLALTGGGVVAGVGAALALTRLLGNLLYQMSPRDPWTFILAALVMGLVSLVACFVPAWKASRIDPVRALA